MRLIDLLDKIYNSTTVWIAEDPANPEGIYFGFAGDIQLRVASGYEVVEIYPEAYPAIHRFTGITIIVRKENTNAS